MKRKNVILGAGITGLSAGWRQKAVVCERGDICGGICASYYMTPGGKRSYARAHEESYRFESGGGHWIFGTDGEALEFLRGLSGMKAYERLSAVYFPDSRSFVPFPLQNHLSYLAPDIGRKAAEEIINAAPKTVRTFADWLEAYFGRTLCELFFFPFHELYTAGLYAGIAPQDAHKTPVNKDLILKGLKERTPAAGYNTTFIYPEEGLDVLMRKMAAHCDVVFGKNVVAIDLKKREVVFEDGGGLFYEKLVSTLPLHTVLRMARLDVDEPPAPYTSVLVINIGATKGEDCPNHHWLYIPKSEAGFHRVGFYSNVDVSFLPRSSRGSADRVSIYVEKAFRGGMRPSDEEIKNICAATVRELKKWKFISEAEVVDPTYIDVAYTWQYPDSRWVEKAAASLDSHVRQAGRYGKWKFQGITESVRDGLNIREVLR